MNLFVDFFGCVKTNMLFHIEGRKYIEIFAL